MDIMNLVEKLARLSPSKGVIENNRLGQGCDSSAGMSWIESFATYDAWSPLLRFSQALMSSNRKILNVLVL